MSSFVRMASCEPSKIFWPKQKIIQSFITNGTFRCFSTFAQHDEDQLKTLETTSLPSSQELGRIYETEIINFLNRDEFDFKLVPTIQSHDQGIDFKGYWYFPQRQQWTNYPISIIGQCKREKDTTGVKSIREFEGVLSHYITQHRNTTDQHLLGIFVSNSGFSDFAVRQALDSKYPLILVRIDNDNMSMSFFYMNHIAQQLIPKFSTSVIRSVEGGKRITFNKGVL